MLIRACYLLASSSFTRFRSPAIASCATDKADSIADKRCSIAMASCCSESSASHTGWPSRTEPARR